jgi:hypothetical protein
VEDGNLRNLFLEISERFLLKCRCNFIAEGARGRGEGIGAIASSLSVVMGSLKAALERVQSSASLGDSQTGLSLILRADLAVGKNNNRYLDFLPSGHCAHYGEIVTASPHFSYVLSCGGLSIIILGSVARDFGRRRRPFQRRVLPMLKLKVRPRFEFNLLTALTDARGFHQDRECSKLHTSKPCL